MLFVVNRLAPSLLERGTVCNKKCPEGVLSLQTQAQKFLVSLFSTDAKPRAEWKLVSKLRRGAKEEPRRGTLKRRFAALFKSASSSRL